jgi:hypothetical protein
MSITLSGKISFTPLVDVLEQLRQRKATGSLTVNSGDVKKCIFISRQIVLPRPPTSRQAREFSLKPANSRGSLVR